MQHKILGLQDASSCSRLPVSRGNHGTGEGLVEEPQETDQSLE